jgi:hypothetical protein
VSTLAEALAELERTDPEVRKAAERLDAVTERLRRPVCRYCGDPVGTKGAVHSKCEREADQLIDEDES